MWAAEAVHNEMDMETGELTDERRTDIIYGWNDQHVAIHFVLEFKKVSRTAQSRNNYLGPKGLARFVTGTYARGQPFAAMVGILNGPADQIVPAFRRAIASKKWVEELQIRRQEDGAALISPSALFPSRAEFDTEHDRDPTLLAPRHDTIRIAHVFLSFGYSV